MIHQPFQNMGEFLRAELAPFPNRWGFTWRLVLTGCLAIIISTGCHIPYMALSLIVVFYTVQVNSLYTRIAGILIIGSLPIAVASGILMLRYTYDYPLLRILCGSAIFFVSMYFIRILKIGIAFLGVALVGIYVQTYADQTDMAEYIVHQIAWAFLAMIYPAILSLVVCCLLFPAKPGRQLRDAVRRQLIRVAERLEASAAGTTPAEPLSANSVQRGIGDLQKLQLFADVDDKIGFADKARRRAAVVATSELLHAAADLPAAVRPLPVAERLRTEILSLAESVVAGDTYHMRWAPTPEEAALLQAQPELEDMYRTLVALDRFAPPATEPEKPKLSLVASDALTNPMYTRFALKALLASLIAYVFYNAVRWEGIHTAMLTCCIVAYPTLGSSVRKIILRVCGGLLGSMSALFLFLFILPHVDGVVGLLLAMLPPLFVGAWLGSGSERIAYVGIQMIVTLSLPILEHSGPTIDLTEVRDRIMGILIGITISLVLYTTIWPESEADLLRGKLVGLLRGLGGLVRPTPIGKSAVETVSTAGDDSKERAVEGQMAYAEQRMRTVALFNECEDMLERVALEPEYRSGRPAMLFRQGCQVLELGREIVRARDTLRRLQLSSKNAAPANEARILSVRDKAAALLDAYAATVERQADEPPQEERRQLLAAENELSSSVDKNSLPLLDATRRLARQVAALPSWSVPEIYDSATLQEACQP